MHDYAAFVQREMESRNWNASDVARAGDLNRQVVHAILRDQRDTITQVPDAKTIDGLARAFSVSRETVLAHVAAAMGLPVKVERADVTAVSDAELVSEIARRLKAGADDGTPIRPEGNFGTRHAPGDLDTDYATDADILRMAAHKGPNRGRDDN